MKEKFSKPARDRNPGDVFAKKSFGQNFLVDQNFVGKIVDALAPGSADVVAEIGPGRGALTERVLDKAGRVVAVELDKDLIPLLAEKFAGRENFRLVRADALKVDFSRLTTAADQRSEFRGQSPKLKLVANLPYYISTAILQRLIEQRAVFSVMVLMFQREVVERITAPPGDSRRGFLSVLAEAYLEAEKLFDVPPSAFRPAPKIWSAVVRLTPKVQTGIADDRLFRDLVSAGFRQRRKTIFNNLKTAGGEVQRRIEGAGGGLERLLENSGVEANRRAETLTLGEWQRLVSLLS